MDWRELARQLWHSDLHVSPREFLTLTPAEIDLALDGDLDSPRPPPGSTDPSEHSGGMEGYAAWWRGLSRAEKIEYARRR